MKAVVTTGDKTRVYEGLNQKGINSLITGISNMRYAEGFQDEPFTMKVEDEGPAAHLKVIPLKVVG